MPDLIGLAVVFLVLALISYILGARGIAGLSMNIAKWLVIIFVVLAIISLIF
ncbi:membrane protein [Methanosarcina sp. 2.H.T.1A.6]|nr:membrane protein [Methanosarcina sp. 2.H.T.1A.3]KKG24097.1 membrane protein [Methanosarcina sp. 2.H.T.1A.6]KKG26563.1 membrane protein [Methanosarcina sp. 2.H.T.1A.8]KKG27462.1 membrane protein [Methanosarcina sp. 2.H.T.1A.15]